MKGKAFGQGGAKAKKERIPLVKKKGNSQGKRLTLEKSAKKEGKVTILPSIEKGESALRGRGAEGGVEGPPLCTIHEKKEDAARKLCSEEAAYKVIFLRSKKGVLWMQRQRILEKILVEKRVERKGSVQLSRFTTQEETRQASGGPQKPAGNLPISCSGKGQRNPLAVRGGKKKKGNPRGKKGLKGRATVLNRSIPEETSLGNLYPPNPS